MRHRIAAAVVACAVLGGPGAAEAAERYPPKRAMSAVHEFVDERRGVVGVALVDSRGAVRGVHARRPFAGASVSKAMLLVSYLRATARAGRPLARWERARLGPMITRSSNRAATWVYGRVGDAALRRLARRAGMTDFAICCSWARAWYSARDQALFFARFERLTPRRFRPYARDLLASVRERQSWGIPKIARPLGFEVLHKPGWRPTTQGHLVHQAARLRRAGRRFSLAVLTDGNPSYGYGMGTIAGITRRLLHEPARADASALGTTPALRRARLWNVQSLDPDIRVDVRYRTRNNFTGRRLPGYCKPWVHMLRRPARALALVQRDLEERGLGLKVFDGYRPARASRAMVRWAHRTGREHLVGTYIASRSHHNRGHAVDLTLVRLDSGRELHLGRFDSFRASAHTRNASGRKLRNRMTLVRAMKRRGFANYHREWWHFEHRVRGPRLLDIRIGC